MERKLQHHQEEKEFHDGMNVYIVKKQKLYNLLQIIKDMMQEHKHTEEFDTICKFQTDLHYIAPELLDDKWYEAYTVLRQLIPDGHCCREEMTRVWNRYIDKEELRPRIRKRD